MLFNKRIKAIARRCSPHPWQGMLALSLVVPTALMTLPAQAGEYNGKSYFDHAPRLIRSASSMAVSDSPSTYQFTLMVPENAGAPLQAVRIVQDINLGQVKFDPAQTQAFLGDSFAGGPSVGLASIGGNQPESSEVTVVFDPPVMPGKTVTVSLETDRNPEPGGVYLFGVTAYPLNDSSNGLFLGFGRFHVSDRH
jgi:Protein of unknown function (DUF2808)